MIPIILLNIFGCHPGDRAALPDPGAPPPAAPTFELCRPPRVFAGAAARYEVTGLTPGERAYFQAAEETATCTTSPCPGQVCYAGYCSPLLHPRSLGVAAAGADGVAALSTLVPERLAGHTASVEAFVRRVDATGAVAWLSAGVVTSSIEAIGDPGGACDGPDVCADAPDADRDGTLDACDLCPGRDDGADADGDGDPDGCDPLSVLPGQISLRGDPGERASARLTLATSGSDAHYRVTTSGCPWLSLDSGGPVADHGVLPAGGVAQLDLDADLTGLNPGVYTCTIHVETSHLPFGMAAANPGGEQADVAVELTVDPPGLDVTLPNDSTMPAGIDGPIVVTVTDELGVGVAGAPVSFTLDAPPPGVTLSCGATTCLILTGADGDAQVVVDTPDDRDTEVDIDIEVTDPTTAALVAATRIHYASRVMDGSIYYWDLTGGGTIRRMPANLVLPPTWNGLPKAFAGASVNGRCVGCHTASPTVVPSLGVAAVFANDEVSRQIVLPVNGGPPIATFAGSSGDNDFSPDSTRIAWNTTDIHVYDIAAGTDRVIPGANTASAELFPTWAADGQHIAYVHCAAPLCYGGDYWMDARGGASIRSVDLRTGQTVELVPAEPDRAIYYPELSPDGRWLIYNKSQLDAGGSATSYASETAELWIVPVSRDAMTTTGSPRRLDHANGPSGANSWPTWAPDGSFFAFASNRAGPATSWDVYVAAFDTMTGLDSPAVPLKHASDPGRNEHIPAWGP